MDRLTCVKKIFLAVRSVWFAVRGVIVRLGALACYELTENSRKTHIRSPTTLSSLCPTFKQIILQQLPCRPHLLAASYIRASERLELYHSLTQKIKSRQAYEPTLWYKSRTTRARQAHWKGNGDIDDKGGLLAVLEQVRWWETMTRCIEFAKYSYTSFVSILCDCILFLSSS